MVCMEQQITQPQTILVQQPPTKKLFAPIMLAVLIFVLLGVLVGLGWWLYTDQQNQISKLNTQVTELNKQLAARPITTYTSTKGVVVDVYVPVANTKVKSPLIVVGMVPGNWSFENNFPVQLKDSQGKVIAHASAQLHGTSQTSDLQPFTASLTVPAGQSGGGTLVLQYDNPSGLSDKADSVSIPVQF